MDLAVVEVSSQCQTLQVLRRVNARIQTIGALVCELNCLLLILHDVQRSRGAECFLVRDIIRWFHPSDDGRLQRRS